MAQLSQADFYAKWVPLLADNVFQDIDGARFEELLADVRDSFAPATLATAPPVAVYDPARVYGVGELARHTPAGQVEVFGYALQAGLLPPPSASTTAAWRAIPPPVAATVLWQDVSLAQARGLASVVGAGGADSPGAGQVQPGRLYRIRLANADDGTPRYYYVWGLVGSFDAEGTLAQGSTRTPGSLELATGTFTPRAGGGGAGTVTSVDGHGPGSNGDVVLPADDIYPAQAKRSQVVSLFTSTVQREAADVPLTGDPRPDYLYAQFYDFAGGFQYTCFPNSTQPDSSGNATAWWVRLKP